MRAIIILLAFALLAPPPAIAAQEAEARTLLSMRPANIKSALGELGFVVTVTTNPDGVIMMEEKQKHFTVLLGMCSATSCKLIQTKTCADSEKASPDVANRWNNTKMYGRAVMQGPGIICIDNVIYATDGLVSLAQLRSQAEGVMEIRVAMEDFFAKS
jgi:hypothetical protein